MALKDAKNDEGGRRTEKGILSELSAFQSSCHGTALTSIENCRFGISGVKI
jgi:hypothetical protein